MLKVNNGGIKIISASFLKLTRKDNRASQSQYFPTLLIYFSVGVIK